MTSAFDPKLFSDKFYDVPLTARDAFLPGKNSLFSARADPAWCRPSNTWLTASDSPAYNLGDDRRDVFPSGSGRIAKAPEAPLSGHHEISANTTNRVRSLHPATISSSRTIGGLKSPTRSRTNGFLAADTNTAMTSLGKSSLLSGSAPDIDPVRSRPSPFATHRSSTIGNNLDQFDVRGTAEFVPQHLQDQAANSARSKGNHGIPFSQSNSELSEWSYTAPHNMYDSSATQQYDQHSGIAMEPLNPPYKGYRYDNPTSLSAMSSSQEPWNLTSGIDGMHLRRDASVRHAVSRLRPDVAAYQPSRSHRNGMGNVPSSPAVEYGDDSSGLNDFYPVNQIPPTSNSNNPVRNGSTGSGHASDLQARPYHAIQPATLMTDADTSAHTAVGSAWRPHASTFEPTTNHNPRQYDSKHTSYVPMFLDRDQVSQNQYGFVYPSSELSGFNGSPYEITMNTIPPASVETGTGPAASGSESPKSPLLIQFLHEGKFLKQSPEKHPWPLRAIKNHVVEFCGDQLASRWIQGKMDQASSEEKDMLWSEIITNARQLMSDNYANYVMQKMFDFCTQAQKKTLGHFMKGHMIYLSHNQFGCRVVQKAFEHILTDQQASLVKELDGFVIETVENAHGNHVIQKAIECIPGEHIQFIVDAHRNEVVRLAKHTFGCRVIQRILEHCTPQVKRPILDELHTAIPTLIDNSFGNYVIQCIITKGSSRDKNRVISFVQQQLLYYSTHKFASNVVEKALEHAEDGQRGEMLRQLTSPDPNNLMQTPVLHLIKDQFGNYVMQTVLKRIQGPAKARLVEEIRRHLYALGNSGYTKQVIAMSRALNDVTGAHSPSNASTGPPTPPTPTSPNAGGKHGVPVKAVVELTSSDRNSPSHDGPQFC